MCRKDVCQKVALSGDAVLNSGDTLTSSGDVVLRSGDPVRLVPTPVLKELIILDETLSSGLPGETSGDHAAIVNAVETYVSEISGGSTSGDTSGNEVTGPSRGEPAKVKDLVQGLVDSVLRNLSKEYNINVDQVLNHTATRSNIEMLLANLSNADDLAQFLMYRDAVIVMPMSF